MKEVARPERVILQQFYPPYDGGPQEEMTDTRGPTNQYQDCKVVVRSSVVPVGDLTVAGHSP